MRVLINPERDDRGDGPTAQVSWKNDALLAALDRLFAVRGGERIAQLEIDHWGITARFESTTQTNERKESSPNR